MKNFRRITFAVFAVFVFIVLGCETAPEENFTVTYVTEHGTAPAPITVKNRTTLTEAQLPTLTAEGYEFLGWYLGETQVSPNTLEIYKDITLTAKWKKSGYLGSKAPTEAKAVGDIVFTDGSATPYTNDLQLESYQKEAAVAIIFYAGTGLNSGNNVTTSRTLGVGLKHADFKLEWCIQGANGSSNIRTIQNPVKDGFASGENLTFMGDSDGSDNLEQIKAFLSDYEMDDTSDKEKYPAFYYAKNYIGNFNLSGTNYTSGWYLPSAAELHAIWKEKDTVDAASTLCGGDKFENKAYWSSTQASQSDDINDIIKQYMDIQACLISFSNGKVANENKDVYNPVCAIRVFETKEVEAPIDPDDDKTKYTVTYKTEHGTEPEPITVVENTELSEAQLPELSEDGFKFYGWYDEDIEAEPNYYKVTKDVTLVAKWKIAYIGIKEPSEEKEIGDIVFTDGSATPYTDDLRLSDLQKNSAVAVIFYVGSKCNNNGDTRKRTYGVGIKQTDEEIQWCTEEAHGYKKNILPIQCYGDFEKAEFLGDLDGSDNFNQLKEFLSSENSGTTDDTDNLELYPAFNFAENYSSVATNLKGTNYETGWWLPTMAEIYWIAINQRIVENAVYLCGGKKYGIDWYWTSSQEPDHDIYNQAEWVWALEFHIIWNIDSDHIFSQNYPKDHKDYACVIREF